ncbi:MFS transporter [Thermomicrobium roseum]|uniref:Permease of the major facilitator superfamily n=1 Tax=Thermomicrobium roseum (strain ATCC 27502 / DSM 5159 / P-2) TaxID=309801 RepID=B9L3F1_THERP|nr:MFS transporter [Thermomicrobium roseum]ACM06971.1 permease of the major facilitator superfamily [Thermomicrobium roseum DSM 5159]
MTADRPAAPSGETSRLARLHAALTASALAVPAYRRYWAGMLVSNIGSWLQLVAQGWLILALTGSPAYLGLYGLLRSIPTLTITLVGGAVADRVDRRRILLVTQSLAALLALLLGILDLTGTIRPWQILAIAFATATVMAFDNPARQAMVPGLVGNDRVASAVGLNSAAWNAAAVIGPSLAGLLVAAAGTGWAFVLNGVSYLPVLWAVWTIAPAPPERTSTTSLLVHVRVGLRAVRHDRRLLGLLTLLAVPTFLGRPYLQLMPVFARDILHTSAAGYGALMGINGVGALSGALLVGRLGARQDRGRILFLVNLVFAATLVGFALSRWLELSAILLFLIGASQTLLMALTNTLIQLIVPDEFRGRVMALYTLIPMGLMPLGTMALGGIGDLFGVPATVAVAASGALVFTLAGRRLFPEVYRLA